MTYQNLLAKLFAINLSTGMKFGLKNMELLAELLHHPERSFNSIHVAGTNGKGSVTMKIASALEKSGYRVGLYTSPHISCFRERIRVNKEMISEKSVECILASLYTLLERHKITATFFELTTCMAFLYFARSKVDFAVIETGLGGRLDATNILSPCLSIITSISLDHTELLGYSINEIAREKGGIIKKAIPTIIGPLVPFDEISTICKDLNSPLIQVNQSFETFEEENTAIALSSLNLLANSFPISNNAIKEGLKSVQPCRFEIIEGSPLIVLDVGHNEEGIRALFKALHHRFPHKTIRVLFGLSKNKAIIPCLKEIITHSSYFHLLEAPNGRGFPTSLLKQNILELTSDAIDILEHSCIQEAVKKAHAEAKKLDQLLVVCGSFFIMADVREALGYREIRDSVEINERL